MADIQVSPLRLSSLRIDREGLYETRKGVPKHQKTLERKDLIGCEILQEDRAR